MAYAWHQQIFFFFVIFILLLICLSKKKNLFVLLVIGLIFVYFIVSSLKVPCSNTDSSSQLFQKDLPTPCNNGCSYKGPMVYGFIDLFSDIGDSWHWGFEMDENRINSSSYSPTLDSSNLGYGIEDKKLDKNTNPLAIQIVNQGQLHSPTVKLDALEEESEDESGSMSSSDSSRSIREELAGNIATKKQETKVIGLFLCFFVFWFCCLNA